MFEPGQSGKPNGRPKDSGDRARVNRMFLNDLRKHWEKHGYKAIADAHEHNPAKFVQIVASLLPRDVTLNIDVSNEFIEALKVINARGRAANEGMGTVLLGRAEVRDLVLEGDSGALAGQSLNDD